MKKPDKIGVMFRGEWPPEALPQFAQDAENLGFQELWLIEDLGLMGGISGIATALAMTNHITVGIGIIPSVVRNVAFAAMEFATLARLYPNRLKIGIGHGVGSWMKEIGAFPTSQLAAIEEVTITMRHLLRGETVSYEGKHVYLDNIVLKRPPETVPPIYLGVTGPKSLQISGKVADGTIIPEFCGPDYIQWAHQQILQGQIDSDTFHRLTLYMSTLIQDDTQEAISRAKQMLAPTIYKGHVDKQLRPMGIVEQLAEMRSELSLETFISECPEEWIHQIAWVGGLSNAEQRLEKLLDAGIAGIHSLVLVPFNDASPSDIYSFSGGLLNALRN